MTPEQILSKLDSISSMMRQVGSDCKTPKCQSDKHDCVQSERALHRFIEKDLDDLRHQIREDGVTIELVSNELKPAPA